MLKLVCNISMFYADFIPHTTTLLVWNVSKQVSVSVSPAHSPLMPLVMSFSPCNKHTVTNKAEKVKHTF